VTHLTPDEFVDAADGILGAARRQHVDACELCRRELDTVVDMLRSGAAGPVPEPSPLFWDHFSARVRDAIAAEPSPRRTSWSDWLGWPALAPMAGLAILVLAIVATLPGNLAAPVGDDRPSVDLSAAGDVTMDAEWRALAEVVGPLDWDTAVEAGLVTAPGAADVAMLDLSSDERRELSRLMASELAPPES
jgi:hypothetical protein